MGFPYYYTEFKQRPSDKLTQIGSLCRISGYLNAVARVKLMQSIAEVPINSVTYLDNQFLALKNSALTPKISFTNNAHAFNLTELGKWQLLLETQIQHSREVVPPLNQSMNYQLTEIFSKPLSITANEILGEPSSDHFPAFKRLFGSQDETVILQKYLTFVANRAYF